MHSLLKQYGYKQTAKDRYLSPNSTSKLAGVKVFDDGRAYSHHAVTLSTAPTASIALSCGASMNTWVTSPRPSKTPLRFSNVTNNPDHEYDEGGRLSTAQKWRHQLCPRQQPRPSLWEISQITCCQYRASARRGQLLFCHRHQAAAPVCRSSGSGIRLTVMGRRWVTNQRNFSSLYLLNIGETGSGKEHSKTVLERLLEEAGLDELIGPAGYTWWGRGDVHPDQETSSRQRD